MSPMLLSAAAVGLLLFMGLQQRRWLPYGIVLASLASFVWVYSYPTFSALGVSLSAAELLLIVSLLAGLTCFARDFALHPSGISPISGAMFVFMVACALGVVVGVSSGVSLRFAVESARGAAFFAVFWLALLAWRDPGRRRVMLGCAVALATLSVGLQVTQLILGEAHRVFISGSMSALVVNDASGFLRVRPPGLTLVYASASFAASYLLWGPRTRRGYVAAFLCLCLLGIVLSFNRNMMVGLVLGIAVAGFLAPRKTRLVLVLATAFAIASLSLMLVLAAAERSGDDPSPVVARIASIADVDELESGTLSIRTGENQLARKALIDHRVLGIGWGTWYGVKYMRVVGGRVYEDRVQWIHNQYYGLWMRTGLLGLGALLAASGLAALAGVRRLWSDTHLDDAWLGGGIIGALVSILASSFVGLYLTEPPSVVVFAGVLALAAVLESERRNGELEREFPTPLAEPPQGRL